MENKKVYIKFGFLAFIGLLIIFIYYADWKSSNETSDEPIKEETVTEDEINNDSDAELSDIEGKYSLEEIDLYSSEYEEYEELGVFDYESYYKDNFGSSEYKEIESVVSVFVDSLLKQKNEVELSDELKVDVDEKIDYSLFKRDGKVEDLVIYPTSPIYKNEIKLGASVVFEGSKSEVFIITILEKEEAYVIQDIVSDWSD